MKKDSQIKSAVANSSSGQGKPQKPLLGLKGPRPEIKGGGWPVQRKYDFVGGGLFPSYG